MSEKTGIEWADSTWSPWRGCTKVSAGCAHCYAETLSKRNPDVFGEWGKGKPRVINKNWNEPVKWNREFMKNFGVELGAPRPRVFPSLCDWLDEEVPAELRARFMQLTCDTPNLDWLLLTKRPEHWAKLIEDAARWAAQNVEFEKFEPARKLCDDWLCSDGRFAGFPHIQPPKNIWIGTSAEDQPNMDRRGPELIKIPARFRFLSLEPLLGPISLTAEGFIPATGDHPNMVGYMMTPDDGKSGLSVSRADALRKSGIDWVIVGGESGPGARPCNVAWIRDIVRQCAEAGVPCFVKQLGSDPFFDPLVMDYNQIGKGLRKITHPKGGDPAEWPEDLRVRQMPEVKP